MSEKFPREGDTGKPRVLCIIGPTASGKTSLAVDLALRFSGEVISADSRQVYRGLDIGTGKVTEKEARGVPHHLIDIADPKDSYSVADFKRDASMAIREITARGKLPIVAGGTFFYVDALLEGEELPDVPPNEALRARLEAADVDTLFGALERTDPERARTIDPKNKRRIIRALEIIEAIGTVPKKMKAIEPPYRVLTLGIDIPKRELWHAIARRLLARIEEGMIEEGERLHADGLSFERMDALGLEYRYLALFLQGKMDKEEMLSKLETEIRHFAKRQMTWLRRKKDIVWVQKEDREKIHALIETFLKK